MKKLRTKLLVFILLPVLGILILTGVASFYVARHILVQQMLGHYTVGLQQAVDQLEIGAWRGLQTMLVLNAVERSARIDIEELRQALHEVRKTVPVAALFMAFPDGRFVADFDPGRLPAGYDPRTRPWYKLAAESAHPVVMPLRWSDIVGAEVLTVAQRLTDDEGKLRGVIGYHTSISTIRDRMASMSMLQEHPDAVIALFLDDGWILVHSDRQKIGTSFSESTEPLHRAMWDAVKRGERKWHGMGEIGNAYWYGGFGQTSIPGVYLALEIPLQEVVSPIMMLLTTQGMIGLIAGLILLVIIHKVANKIVRPVKMLAQAAVRLRNGDYGQRLPVVTRDELGSLVESFNTMAEGLQQRDFIRDTFGRYVAPEVAAQLLEAEDGLKLGGETREVSILISDLRGFTAATAEMPSEQVIFLLNRYLGKMLEILIDHNATVDEIVGDGILAIFGAPTEMADHPARAVACSLRMQAAMEEVNRLNEDDGLPHLEMGIGVNTGSVVVGNIGSERRTKYGVVGAEVNFCGRIESYTLGGQVLISQSTLDRVRDIVEVRDVVDVEMKGLPGVVKLYDVHAIHGAYNVRLRDVPDAPDAISEWIPAAISRLENKTVTPIAHSAWITHVSERSSVVLTNQQLPPMAEVRIDLLEQEQGRSVGEVFAKVLSAESMGNGYSNNLRFTFVSPEMRRLLRGFVARKDGSGACAPRPTTKKS
ncbi:MAG: HAMP domain-containing protein [Desulfomonile sp.]|nr:HAMP domain-containing protein [Desulfomonile sp.]